MAFFCQHHQNGRPLCKALKADEGLTLAAAQGEGGEVVGFDGDVRRRGDVKGRCRQVPESGVIA